MFAFQILPFVCITLIRISKPIITVIYFCYRGDVKYVLVGALTRSDAKIASKIHKVKTIIKHPDYKPPSKYNDIALLETEKV